MNLQTVKIEDIKIAKYNPRTIRGDEFEGLKNSLKIFGQQENFILNKDHTLISGHQRLEAAKQLGWTEVTANIVDLPLNEEKKLNLIMNSRSIQGVFDELKLSEILEEIKFDDDYQLLRFDTLEPLDLSDVSFEEPDSTEMSDRETYLNQSIKQISLAYGIDEFEELMEKIKDIIKNGEYGLNPSEIFAVAVRKFHEDIVS